MIILLGTKFSVFISFRYLASLTVNEVNSLKPGTGAIASRKQKKLGVVHVRPRLENMQVACYVGEKGTHIGKKKIPQ